MNKNLIIRADATTRIGTGHIMRCIALAQAWQDQGGDVTFLSHCDSEAMHHAPCALPHALCPMRPAPSFSVGWSDHSVNPGVICRAIHRWEAKMIEFHLDLDAPVSSTGQAYRVRHDGRTLDSQESNNDVKNSQY